MKKIVVSSNNPVKIDSSLEAFKLAFPSEEFEIVGIPVPSGVSAQPMTEKETLTGAENRVKNVMEKEPNADYWIGIEGGLEEFEGEFLTFAWVVVRSKNLIGKGRSGAFFLPEKIKDLMEKENLELGDADDKIFGKSDSKRKNGSVGILTKNLVTRKNFYIPAIILALIPFLHENLFKENILK